VSAVFHVYPVLLTYVFSLVIHSFVYTHTHTHTHMRAHTHTHTSIGCIPKRSTFSGTTNKWHPKSFVWLL